MSRLQKGYYAKLSTVADPSLPRELTMQIILFFANEI